MRGEHSTFLQQKGFLFSLLQFSAATEKPMWKINFHSPLGHPEFASPREHTVWAWGTAGLHKAALWLRQGARNRVPRDVLNSGHPWVSPGLLSIWVYRSTWIWLPVCLQGKLCECSVMWLCHCFLVRVRGPFCSFPPYLFCSLFLQLAPTVMGYWFSLKRKDVQRLWCLLAEKQTWTYFLAYACCRT